jgi:hypothetical protein
MRHSAAALLAALRIVLLQVPFSIDVRSYQSTDLPSPSFCFSTGSPPPLCPGFTYFRYYRVIHPLIEGLASVRFNLMRKVLAFAAILIRSLPIIYSRLGYDSSILCVG